jgi:hypothetical protein
MVPAVCPICRSDKIRQTLRETPLSAYLDGLTARSTGALAYHRDLGHVFLLVTRTFTGVRRVRNAMAIP